MFTSPGMEIIQRRNIKKNTDLFGKKYQLCYNHFNFTNILCNHIDKHQKEKKCLLSLQHIFLTLLTCGWHLCCYVFYSIWLLSVYRTFWFLAFLDTQLQPCIWNKVSKLLFPTCAILHPSIYMTYAIYTHICVYMSDSIQPSLSYVIHIKWKRSWQNILSKQLKCTIT